MNVLLNTEATTVTIQRGKKLGYALRLSTEDQSVENFKKYAVTEAVEAVLTWKAPKTDTQLMSFLELANY